MVKRLLVKYPKLAFSISACTRTPRAGEIDGKDYYFFSVDKFKELIEQDAFVEYEMVYEGKYYGTLKAEMERIWDNGQAPIVDIDVMGALNVQKQYPDNSISLFIKAPSIAELRNRLIKRATDTPEMIEERIQKAEFELSYSSKFDTVIVNNDIDQATAELIDVIENFLAD